MKINKKIPAFTLIELVVVMVLSGIIMSLSFLAVEQVKQMYSSYEKNTNNALEIGDFDAIFRTDFERYDWINQENESLIFNKKNDAQKTLYYTFNTNNIIRATSLFADTFDVNLININTFFEGEFANNGWIDSCSFLLGQEDDINQQLHFNFKKTYSSEDLWQLDNTYN
jgi:prepilin-type N-terminal cleavage/methylation domain-containing protein